MSSGFVFAALGSLLLSQQPWAEDVEPRFILVNMLLFLGLLVASGTTVVFGLVLRLSNRQPQAMVLRLPTAHELRHGRWRIAAGGLSAGLVAMLTSLGSDWSASTVLVVVVVALAFGLSFGLAVWVFCYVWVLPIAAATNETPSAVHRKDVRTRLFSVLFFGFIGLFVGAFSLALVALVEFGRDDRDLRSWLVDTLLLGLWLGLNVGLVLGLVGGLRNGAAPLLFCTQMASALRGRPVRFVPMLESARERQVLRQAGAVYQFRHADLQDRLADEYREGRKSGFREPQANPQSSYPIKARNASPLRDALSPPPRD